MYKNEFRYLCKYIFTLCGIFARKYIFGIYIIHELIFQIMFYSTNVKTSYIKQETTAGEQCYVWLRTMRNN